MAPARAKRAKKKDDDHGENVVRDGATEDHEGVVDGATQGPAEGGVVNGERVSGRSTADDDDDDDE
jgi:hypothetical protein